MEARQDRFTAIDEAAVAVYEKTQVLRLSAYIKVKQGELDAKAEEEAAAAPGQAGEGEGGEGDEGGGPRGDDAA